jgi:hypothetical protein
MTFICPICKEVASSKHEKVGKMKKKKLWRQRTTERVQHEQTVGGLAFHCPCCKEARSLSVHNPFDEFTTMGHKKRKDLIKKKKLKKLNTMPPKAADETVLTASGLAQALGFSPEDVDRAGFRVHREYSASVSWDDATEMRRLILKDILLHAALKPLLVMQCAARTWRAKARVKRLREMALKSSRRKNKTSRGLSMNIDQAYETKDGHK